VFQAYDKRDWAMVELLRRYGGVAEASTAGLFRQTELARKMLAGEVNYGTEGVGGDTMAEQMLWGAACGGDPEIVRMAIERVDRPRSDIWWFHILEQPLRIWNHGSTMADKPEWDRGTYLTCFRLILERCDPNLRGRVGDEGRFGLTILHSVAGSREHVTPEERVGFATALLDAGARLLPYYRMLQPMPSSTGRLPRANDRGKTKDRNRNQPLRNEEHEERTEKTFVPFVSSWLIFGVGTDETLGHV
jgi:hypothetical protein